MKYFSAVSLIKFSWDHVIQGFWLRYPNPYSKHVLTEDIVRRDISRNKIYSLRLLTKTNKLPRWGEVIVRGPRVVFIVEESTLDLQTRTLVTYTRNIGYTRLLNFSEKCTYSPDPQDEESTVCERQAWISSNVFGFSFAIQAFAFERFKKNSLKALQGFEHVLGTIRGSKSEQDKSEGSSNEGTAKSKQTTVQHSLPGEAFVSQCKGRESRG